MSTEVNSFIYSFGPLPEFVKKELSKRKLNTYAIQSRNPWAIITSGRILKTASSTSESSYKQLKYSPDIDSFLGRPKIPILSSLTIKYIDELSSLRQASFSFIIYSKTQLDEYAPYYFQPGASVFIEYGMHNEAFIYDTKISEYSTLFKDEETFHLKTNEKIKNSNCKYANFRGIISNFNITYNTNNTYTCEITADSIGRTGFSFMLNNQLGGDMFASPSDEPTKKTALSKFTDEILPEFVTNKFNGKLNNNELNDIDNIDKFDKSHFYIEKANGDNDVKYVSFAFVEFLINSLSSIKKINTNESLYKISSWLDVEVLKGSNVKQVLVGNHAKLRSLDPSICFIWNESNKVFNKHTFLPFLFNYNNNTYGYIRHMYINLFEISNLIKVSRSVLDFFNGLYSKINSCFAEFWNFKLTYSDELRKIYTMDTNCVSDFNPNDETFKINVLGTEQSIISNLSFSTNAGNEIATQVAITASDAMTVNGNSNKMSAIWGIDKDLYKDVIYDLNNYTVQLTNDTNIQYKEMP
ncbi:MAG TPA: hypothetical protein PLY35_10340 [Thermotogota bacterium]|nr:hypothetical protein [Thermotogota bacterium]